MYYCHKINILAEKKKKKKKKTQMMYHAFLNHFSILLSIHLRVIVLNLYSNEAITVLRVSHITRFAHVYLFYPCVNLHGVQNLFM